MSRNIENDISRFPHNRLTYIHFGDGSVSAYLGPVWLSYGESLEEARDEARTIVIAFMNGAHWSQQEFPRLADIIPR